MLRINEIGRYDVNTNVEQSYLSVLSVRFAFSSCVLPLARAFRL